MIKVLLLAVLFIIPLTAGYPTGAPIEACESMMPKHGNNKPLPSDQSPYSFVQSAETYLPGDIVMVYFHAPVGLPFKGMMVQAYDPLTNKPIGEFLEGIGLKKMDECSSITHSDNQYKKAVILAWYAPQNYGNVRFRATIVQKFDTFYYGLHSVIQNHLESGY